MAIHQLNATTAEVQALAAQVAALRESVNQKAAVNGLSSGQLRYYTQNENDYVQIFWTVSSTLNYFLQFNCTAATGGLYKTENGRTTLIKSV